MKGKDKVLRSAAEARAQSNLNILEVPDGFPVGPLPCLKDDLLATVKAFTTRVDTGRWWRLHRLLEWLENAHHCW